MSQQVQDLIDKIKTEGVDAATKEAADIKQKAQKEAEKILQNARQQADQIINEAKQETEKFRSSAEMSLKHSSRDMLLSLRKSIESILQRIVKEDVSGALKSEQLADIITHVVEKSLDQKTDISSLEIVLNKQDKEALEKSLLSKLQKKIKEPIVFKGSDDISGGFTISFDDGKSSFDFTDDSLAQYLGNFLNSQVAQIVKESA